MKFALVSFLFGIVALSGVLSYPVEVEPGHYVDFIPLRRVPRRVIEEEPSRDEPEMSGTHSHGYGYPNEYVDYGAYTGGYGAFGWYSDHPVHGGHGGY